MYLCFFPVTIGMVKGLRSPDPLQLDLMRTYNASQRQIFWKLRCAGLRALPVRQPEGRHRHQPGRRHRRRAADRRDGGLGARLLTGSYYGQTMQIWSAC